MIFDSPGEEQDVEIEAVTGTDEESVEGEEAKETEAVNASELEEIEIPEIGQEKVEQNENESTEQTFMSITEEQDAVSPEIEENREEIDNAQATAAKKIAEGNCGTKLTWYLTDEEKLYINGTGEMAVFDYEAPWRQYIDFINEIYLSEGITNIGNYAFSDCYKVREISIPESVTSIGNEAFAGCDSLGKINIPTGVTTIGNNAFIGCYNLEKVTLPQTLTSIGEWAFAKCESLSSITIPKNVKKIQRETFNGCTKLSNVVLPDNLTRIESMAFDLCENLSNITIPKTMTLIDSDAFWGCGLKTISLPASVTKIGEGAFGSCDRLASIYILNSNCNIANDASEDVYREETISKKAVIYGYANSTAQAYAKKYKRTFKTLTTPANTYMITYNANGGKKAPAAQTKKKDKTLTLSKTKPARKGYTFLGWATSKNSTKVSYKPGASFKQNKNTTLYAVWKANTYKVVFHNNNGTGSMSSVYYTYGKSYTLKANTFKRAGYTFKGWNTKADGTARSYADKAQVENLTCIAGKRVSLYAQWSLKKYKITYQLNGGTNHKANPATYTKKTATITLKKPTRKGYTFGGWYTSSSYKTKVTKITKGSTGNKTLYAKWTANSYKIAFDKNGGTGSMDTISCIYDKSYTLRKNAFEREGYTFVGWAKSEEGALKYKDAEKVTNISSVNGKVVVLYAVWEKMNYFRRS